MIFLYREQITFPYSRRIDIPFAQFYRGPPFVTYVKRTTSRWAKGEQGQYVAQNAFLAWLQKGKSGTRPTSPARPTEVLISIFLSAAAASYFLRRSSDRDVLKSLFMRVIWYKRWDSSFHEIHGEFYLFVFITALCTTTIFRKLMKLYWDILTIIFIMKFNHIHHYLIIFKNHRIY